MDFLLVRGVRERPKIPDKNNSCFLSKGLFCYHFQTTAITDHYFTTYLSAITLLEIIT